MPIPGNVVRVTLTYAAPSAWPGELAVNTFHMQNQAGPGATPPNPQYIADQIAAKLVTPWLDISGILTSGTHITGIKAALLDTSGHTISEGYHNPAPTDFQGSGSANYLPPEVAVCVSEFAYTPGTFTSHKGRKRGRMYLPYISSTALSSNGKLATASQTLLVSAWVEAFNAFNTIESDAGRTDPMGVVIASMAGDATYEVTVVAVDDHFDSQRRRQHQSPATVLTGAVTAW